MTAKEYTLTDLEEKINEISSISMFLSMGSCPKEIAFNLQDHMQDEIENLQGMVSYMKVYPQIEAQEQLDSPQKELTP
ncbi:MULTISPECIES: RstC protein [unclassified Vibrio]|uniref:RstC protein n=1 Tax=unclassified Vibrio TaxID=2614977 RepID=UPI00354C04D7